MRHQIASLFNTDINSVSVKATTNEGLDAVGRGEGIAVHCVVLMEKIL
jgi:2-C-methyl-D-erythritol 2,4-cyclodiphosphate synthase